MDPSVILVLAFAIISAIMAAISYFQWQKYDYEKRYLRAVQGFTFLTVVYLVLILLAVCGAPWPVKILFIVIAIVLLVL